MTNANESNDFTPRAKKNLIINAFLMSSPGNQTINSWRQENDLSASSGEDPKFWMNLARLLEDGAFSGVFFADVLGPYDVYKGPGNFASVAKSAAQWPLPDPSYYIPVMAAVTKKLTFGITISTIAEPPYHLARRLGTLDLVSNGRVGWNIVTSYLDSAARNLLNGQNLPDKDERYDRAEEYVDVVYKLFLSSWQDNAVKMDKAKGIFIDHEGIRHIDHVGKYFTVPGPGLTLPSKQKLPVIIQAGSSSKGKKLAARNAEIIFLSNSTKESLKIAIDSVKDLAEKEFNRDISKIKFVVQATVIIGSSDEVDAIKRSILELADDDAACAMFSGWTGVDISKYTDEQTLDDLDHVGVVSLIDMWKEAYPGVERWTKRKIMNHIKVAGSGALFAGSGEEIANLIEEWVEYAGVDGFNFVYTSLPETYERIVEELIPVLIERDLVKGKDSELSGGDYVTFRESLFGTPFLDKTHPAEALSWRDNETKIEFEKRIPKMLKQLKGGN
ncbi:hypothetical protein KDRO_B07440 [Kluyveromyces lactis]|nr:hypothetical protein KDRO_B07440 [Kluyveromyces lactis]